VWGVRRRGLLLWASNVVVRRLAQIAEIFSEYRVLNTNPGQIVEPGNRQVFEVVVRLKKLENLKITLIDFVRLDGSGLANWLVARTMPARRCVHARRHSTANLF